MKNNQQAYKEFLLLLTGNNELSHKTATELAASDSDPGAFYEKHKEQFAERGINKPGNEEQTLCYLLDVLTEHHFVHELDWKADADSLNFAIEEMSKEKIAEVVDEDDEEDAEGMFELIEMAQDRLAEQEFAIIEFPLNSDSHPIALVPLQNEETLNAMIDQLFGGE